MAFVSECAVPVTLPIVTCSQRESEIITRDFNAVAAGSSSIFNESDFSKLLELHFVRQPTIAEVASVTLQFGETGLQLADWLQWAHPTPAKQPYVWNLGLYNYGSSGMGYELDPKHLVELQGYVADVTTELQKKGMWDDVAPKDVTVNVIREGIGSLTPPEGQAVVLKLLRVSGARVEIMLDCGQALSDAAVAVPLLVRGPEDRFVVEALAVGDMCTVQSPTDIEDTARLMAQLHRVPIDWFTSRHRELLEEACPVLKDEPLSTALYVFVHHSMARHKNLDFFPQTDQLRSLLEHLPRPASEHGTKLVSTHGDFWAANILRMPNGNAVVTDMEQSCVSAAATDLAHELHGTESIGHYLRELLGRDPTEQEVYDLWLDAKIASFVEFEILRPVFMKDSWGSTETRPMAMPHIIENTRRFNEFVVALRRDAAVAKAVLDAGADWDTGETGHNFDWTRLPE